ncbi:KPN_02809 family neutral zinc metallopeptidase [Motilibacter deserti]|nr:neutral zinc metallopeptidase [Motilibacter deserti]
MRTDNGSIDSDEVVFDSGGGSGGRGLGLPVAVGGGGLGVVGVVIALIFAFTGGGGGFGSIGSGLDPMGQNARVAGADRGTAPSNDEDLVAFLRFVVDDVQDYWQASFAAAGQSYERTRLVIFRNVVSTGCGRASASTGPFYCPADRQVYLDLEFFQELQTRFGAPGDFAQAYVIAHEFGHHVQNLRGISDSVAELSARNPDDANELSVRTELQADCLAGVWGASTAERNLLEAGDLEEGLRAAQSVGDDVLQEQAQGYVQPDTFTHGSAEQRQTWFLRGFQSGEVSQCDTFSESSV